ncbi:PLP-dependent aminotransferase family protein [Chitinophaga qingshengii]|uniref:PLP-dependent aminotransferase family protein n=1 Tax=Chitinophaga qingshengii TaxID=1569794 RepID=A0ABR7TRX0_9BACT|nr:PLP-dependent aminotransferase family protein [Chitinophaga qingshengii]MBC9933231.1 PLP-dependent aminotransferase family protein [Chitinophaga qingshengii]
MKKDYIYQQIAQNIIQLIRGGVWKPGDKLPSIRTICQEQGISMNTAKRVYLELENKALIISRPQSGYFVTEAPYRRLPLPTVSKPSGKDSRTLPDQLISKVYGEMDRKGLTLFSIGMPSPELLPVAKLNKCLLQASRELKGSGTAYEPLTGNARLRQVVARRSFMWGGRLAPDDLITTSGGMNAISLCMQALTQPGDTIATESPLYPGILQLAKSMGLRVLELPTHPQTGIDVQALKAVVRQIKLCLLVPGFSTPLGCCMPEEHKKAVVQLLDEHQVPLIEDDLYSDLYFGTSRPVSCKAFDKTGNVLWCSSVSKTLAPGYRVGWVSPGRYKEEILRLKYLHTLSNTAVTQEAVAIFLENGGYDLHLRKLRDTLHTNCIHYTNTITGYFPEGTRISRPQGGLSLWVELQKDIDTAELYEQAIRQKISIAPGRMFTLQKQFDNCMRLSLGLPWSEQLQKKLQQLGRIAGNL